MVKILARLMRKMAVELLMPLSDIPDEKNDHLWGLSVGLLLRMSEFGKTQAK